MKAADMSPDHYADAVIFARVARAAVVGSPRRRAKRRALRACRENVNYPPPCDVPATWSARNPYDLLPGEK